MKNIILAIESIIKEAETMKNCYFWKSPSTASARRAYEKKHSHDMITWTEGTDTYTACYIVSCSCANIYANGEYTKNGKKTTLTAIKNSLKRMQRV